MTALTIFAPATSANLGPGFDCMGLALPFGNRFQVRTPDRADRHSYRLTGPEVARDLAEHENLFLIAAKHLAERAGKPLPWLEVEAEVSIPLSRGLGSSSSAVVGGLVAANRLLGSAFDAEGLLRLATEIEGHPDNVAPALLGGVTVAVGSGDRVVHQSLTILDPPGLVVAVPDFELATSVARAALPAVVPFGDAVYNVGRAALLTAALVAGRHEILVDALSDRLHEPYRRSLVPGMDAVVAAARAGGAWGVTLSGAGPTLLAWCPSPVRALVAERMAAAWQQAGISCRTIVTQIATVGTTINEGSPWL